MHASGCGLALSRGFWFGVCGRGIGGGVSVFAQPLGSDLTKSSAIAVKDRVAAGVGLPAFDGDVDVGRADFHREDAPPIGLPRHDLRTRTTERLVTKPAARHMLAHRDPEGVERFRRRMVGPVVLGKAGQCPCRGKVSSATFGGRFGRRQPMKQGSCFHR